MVPISGTNTIITFIKVITALDKSLLRNNKTIPKRR